MLSLSSYDYHLPESLIAQYPLTPPESAKCLYRNGDNIQEYHVSDIISLLDPETLIVFNTTKVVKARILLQNAVRITKE